MDPYAVLGLAPGASLDEAAAAWKRLAKRWHPDRVGDGGLAAAKMAEINAAYDLVRADTASGGSDGTLRRDPDEDELPHVAHGITIERLRRRRTGAWLDASTREALGRELLAVLDDAEPVHLVTRTSTWTSPETRLAVTDRRLLWLLDDAISNRVRFLRLRDVIAVDEKLSWPRRRTATVRIRTREGRKLEFSELAPATAATVTRHVRAARR